MLKIISKVLADFCSKHNVMVYVFFSIQSTTNTFQGVLISDGSSSYAVFIYDCLKMNWGGGVIGWQQNTTQYASHSASGQSSSNEEVCRGRSSSFTSLVYRISSGKSSSVQCLHTSLTFIPLSLTLSNLVHLQPPN